MSTVRDPSAHSQLSSATRAAIDRSSVLRRVVKSDSAQHLIQTARGARAVRETTRFVPLQFGRPRVASYTLRRSGLRVTLRHGARDLAVMNEIFGGTSGYNCYEPPPEIAEILDAKATVRVLDVGANIGLFSLFALTRWPGSTVHSLEPDPGNFALLRRNFADNNHTGRWRIEQVAAFTERAELPFVAGLFSDARVADDSDAETIIVPAVDIFAADHHVDLMKMDIEGSEWAILGDPRMAEMDAAVVVLEWHRRHCPQSDPHAAVLSMLREAGYVDFREVADDGDTGLLWAAR